MAEQQTTLSNPNIALEGAAAPAPAATAAPAASVASQPKTAYEPSGKPGGYYWGTGRRKTAVARVRVRPGSGKMEINGRPVDDFFHELRDREAVVAVFKATNTLGKFDLRANVSGGGYTGQAGAVLLGAARCMLQIDDAFESALRDLGYLTRDSRMKERKKYGQKGARKRFQWTKR